MPLVSLRNMSLALTDPPLLVDVNFQIDRGERVALVGPNGAGKSTLLRLISGELDPDSGQIVRESNIRIARLTQQVPQQMAGEVYDEIAAGLADWAELLSRYHRISQRMADDHANARLRGELERAQHELEVRGGWTIQREIDEVIGRIGLDGRAQCDSLSAGLKRRVLLAKALVSRPDLLLLDEPTNHLDIPSITWLEQFLLDHVPTLLFVTHDRAFLRRLSTRIVDIDRGQVSNWACNYDTFVERKGALLEAQSAEQAEFDKKLAREEAWVRQGIKARRTRNEGRVRALVEMRRIRQQRRELRTVSAAMTEAERSGQMVIEARNVSFAYGDRAIVRDFGTLIVRGDKIGLIGPNGVGKTTLLRLLLGELAPQAGRVRHGTNLQVAYFDQLHAQLDDSKSIVDNVADGARMLNINGRSRHVVGYLQDFLFTADRIRRPMTNLSGGERNRLLLARLFARPSNLLLLDEPTNDLDAETLELLENLVVEYGGTVLLVSHDREFLNNVVTSTLVLEGDGRVGEYVGGYDDWLRQRSAPPTPAAEKATRGKPDRSRPVPARRGLTYAERLELEKLPEKIDDLERRQQQIHKEMIDPAFYKQDSTQIAAKSAELANVERELAEAMARWEEMESRSERP